MTLSLSRQRSAESFCTNLKWRVCTPSRAVEVPSPNLTDAHQQGVISWSVEQRSSHLQTHLGSYGLPSGASHTPTQSWLQEYKQLMTYWKKLNTRIEWPASGHVPQSNSVWLCREGKVSLQLLSVDSSNKCLTACCKQWALKRKCWCFWVAIPVCVEAVWWTGKPIISLVTP